MRDWDKIVTSTIGTAVFITFAGGFIGYSLDAFKDFTGIKKSKRLPNLIASLSRKKKDKLGAAIIALSVALTAGVYTPPMQKAGKEFREVIEPYKQAVKNYILHKNPEVKSISVKS